MVGADGSSNCEWKAGWNKNDVGWWYCLSVENRSYYTSKDGWKEIAGEWYIFDDRGYALQNRWYHDENNNIWYYLDENCKMVMGSKEKPLWKWINGNVMLLERMVRCIVIVLRLMGGELMEMGVG